MRFLKKTMEEKIIDAYLARVSHGSTSVAPGGERAIALWCCEPPWRVPQWGHANCIISQAGNWRSRRSLFTVSTIKLGVLLPRSMEFVCRLLSVLLCSDDLSISGSWIQIFVHEQVGENPLFTCSWTVHEHVQIFLTVFFFCEHVHEQDALFMNCSWTCSNFRTKFEQNLNKLNLNKFMNMFMNKTWTSWIWTSSWTCSWTN